MKIKPKLNNEFKKLFISFLQNSSSPKVIINFIKLKNFFRATRLEQSTKKVIESFLLEINEISNIFCYEWFGYYKADNILKHKVHIKTDIRHYCIKDVKKTNKLENCIFYYDTYIEDAHFNNKNLNEQKINKFINLRANYYLFNY